MLERFGTAAVNDCQEIFPVRNVAVLIAEKVRSPFAREVRVREIAEVKTQLRDFFLVHRRFSLRREIGQYPPVPPENIVHVPHEIVVVAVDPVVVIVSALIGAELFIRPAIEDFLTV